MDIEQIKFFSISDRGHRETNQDYLKFVKGEKYCFFVVADGCGAYEGSEIASRCLCQAFVKNAINMEEQMIENPKEVLQEIISISSKDMINKILKLEFKDACTTMAIACISVRHTIYAHIGDSRIYRISSDSNIWHTKDHSVAEEMIKKKKVTRKKSRDKEAGHMLTKVIAADSSFNAEIRNGRSLKTNETLIICTDGFWEYMPNSWIRKISNAEPEFIPEYLKEYISKVKKENTNVDNLSAIIVCT